jgi:hypothetical protein
VKKPQEYGNCRFAGANGVRLIMFTLIRRSEQNGLPSYAAHRFEYLDEAVWASRETNDDYVIEEGTCGVAPARIVRYRIGQNEMI